MKINHLIILLTLILSPIFTDGQVIGTPTSPAPNCAGNPPAGNTCSTATPICDLNGYCGSTSSSYTADSWSQLTSAFCGSIDNNSFLTFTASSTSLTMNVWLTSSAVGDGIQIFVFSAAGACSGAVTSYLCWNPGTATAGPSTITANGLTPGNTYYIMIDGWGGDVCDYIIGVQSGAALPVNATSSLTAGETICLGESATLTATGGNGVYTWENENGISATSGASVTVTPTSEGTFFYNVSSLSGNTQCPTSDQDSVAVEVISCVCTIFASNTGNVCLGGTADLTASTVTDATAYNWTGPNGFTSSSQNIPTINLPTIPGTYDYTVIATVPDGTCSSTTSITVFGPPSVSLSDAAYCNNTIIPENALISSPTGATYTWANSNTAIGLAANGTGNIPSFVATNSTSNSIQSTITVTPSLNGCVGSPVTYVLTISPTPVMDPVTSIAQCEGTVMNSIPFTSPISNLTYTWSNSNSVIGLNSFGTGNIPTFNLQNPGNTDLTSTITVIPSIGSCDGNLLTFTLTSYPAPTVSAGSSQAVCTGTEVTLVASGAATYTWDNGISDNTPFTPLTTTTYTVTGIGTNGCVNTDQVVVTVNPLPNLNAGADQALCLGESTTLTAIGTGATYTWDNGISNNTTFTPTNTLTYTLTGIDANNCVNTDQVIVVVNPLPNVNAGADFSLCDDALVTLNGSGAQSYTWTNGVTDGNPFVGSLGATTYTVTGTDQNGCVNTDSVTVTVIAVPYADFTADTTIGYPTLQVNFTNLSSPASLYEWNFGNGTNSVLVNNTANQSSSYSQPGIYTVQITASNSICQSIFTMPITVLQFPPTIIQVPNVFTPNNDQVNDLFYMDVIFGETIELTILNRWGEVMYVINNFTDKWNGGEATEGVYFYTYKIKGYSGDLLEGQGNVTLIRN